MIFFGITGQIWVRHIYLKPTTAWGWYAAYGYPGYANANEIWAYESGGGGSGGSWTLAGETRYLYDGKRVVQERDGSNTPLVTYTRGKDLSGSLEGAGGIGGLLARSRGYSGGTWTAHHFYHADGSGNVTYMVDNNQAMVASYRYDPFGRTISSGGTLAAANVYQFSSKELHARSGMYYYLYRFYDPNTQRWLNRDPLGEAAGANLYAFVGNAPPQRIDALGLKLWYCTTPTTMFGGTGRHGYVWNDDPTAQGNYPAQYCGQERSSGSGSGTPTQNTGPVRGSPDGYGDGGWQGTQSDGRDVECVPVDGTDNDASSAAFMRSCNDKINQNPWIGPGVWDCHTSARRLLRDAGYTPPPFRRWNSQFPLVWPSIPSTPRPPVTLPPNYRIN